MEQKNHKAERLKELGFKNYGAFLKSELWAATRERVKGDGKCTVCDSSENLNLHHKTYERLGKEEDNDLVWLCQDCHYRFHAASRFKDGPRTAIGVYLDDVERSQMEALKDVLGQKTLSATIRNLIRLYYAAYSDKFNAEDYL